MKVSIVNQSPFPLPSYQTLGSAGMDLQANLAEPLILQPGQRALVPTGLFIALEPGYEAQIRPRSGLAWRLGLSIPNAPGTIDSDYRGEIKVLLINLGQEPISLEAGERIAQMVITRYERVEWEALEALPETKRGQGGFGSTGI